MASVFVLREYDESAELVDERYCASKELAEKLAQELYDDYCSFECLEPINIEVWGQYWYENGSNSVDGVWFQAEIENTSGVIADIRCYTIDEYEIITEVL